MHGITLLSPTTPNIVNIAYFLIAVLKSYIFAERRRRCGCCCLRKDVASARLSAQQIVALGRRIVAGRDHGDDHRQQHQQAQSVQNKIKTN